MNIEELCAEANRLLADLGVEVADGRTSSVVTPRNVRYYCSLGLVKPPVRDGKRAKYERSHVDDIVAVKRAQVGGASLEQILRMKHEADAPAVVRKMIPDLNQMLTTRHSTFRSEIVRPRLSVDLSLSQALEPFASQHVVESAIVPTVRHVESMGWSVRIGDVMLSGAGEPPTAQQIDSIRAVLEDD
jgi:DNA-binding transcriptional MerR regulator